MFTRKIGVTHEKGIYFYLQACFQVIYRPLQINPVRLMRVAYNHFSSREWIFVIALPYGVAQVKSNDYPCERSSSQPDFSPLNR